jgi:transcription initiation factor TFIIB
VSVRDEVKSIVSAYHLNAQVEQRTLDLCEDIFGRDVQRLGNTQAKIAACLLIACRHENMPASFKEISAMSGITKKELSKTYKDIVQLLGARVEPVNLDGLVRRFCQNVGFAENNIELTLFVAHRALDLVDGRNPLSVAAVSIYMVCLVCGYQAIARKDIAGIAGIAEATLTNLYKILRESAEKVFPPGYDTSEFSRIS